jgi:hypothetical protein
MVLSSMSSQEFAGSPSPSPSWADRIIDSHIVNYMRHHYAMGVIVSCTIITMIPGVQGFYGSSLRGQASEKFIEEYYIQPEPSDPQIADGENYAL